MSELQQLAQIDYLYLIISIVVILTVVRSVYMLLEWFVKKLGIETKTMRNKRHDHELLIATSNNLEQLKEYHTESVKQSIRHDNMIKDELAEVSNEIKQCVQCVSDLQKSVSNIQEKQTDISQSIELQKKANMEEMCDYINQKIRRYINELHGIPEDEYDDFVRLVNAYTGIGGNHGVLEKYKYCINNLHILPVKNKIDISNLK